MKEYRILEKLYSEGTKFQETLYYPQLVDSHTLNQKIDPWDFFYQNEDETEGIIWFTTLEDATNFVEKKKAEDIPVKTIIHELK